MYLGLGATHVLTEEEQWEAYIKAAAGGVCSRCMCVFAYVRYCARLNGYVPACVCECVRRGPGQ